MPSLYHNTAFFSIEPFRAGFLFEYIEESVNRAIIQYSRIAYHRKMGRQLDPRTHRNQRPLERYILFMLKADIHYYLICWTNTDWYYEELKKNQPLFSNIDEKYLSYLKKHRKFRNHLEHFEDRIKKASKKKGVVHMGILFGYKIYFFGEHIEINDSDIQKLRNFYENLCIIADNNFNPLKDRFKKRK